MQSANHKRKNIIEWFWKNLFLLMATVSIISVVTIGFFVISNGVKPFFGPSSDTTIVYLEKFKATDQVRLDGELLTDFKEAFPLTDGEHTLVYNTPQGEETINITIDSQNEDPAQTAVFSDEPESSKLDDSVKYTSILDIKGETPVGNRKVSVVVPEPAYSVTDFLFGSEWKPTALKLYGILPMILGTLGVTIGALILGVPIGILTGVYIAELAPKRVAQFLRPAVELLAGIPSVVFGFFGLMVIVPLIQQIFGLASGTSMLAAIIILGVMILPTVISMTETSLRAVPNYYREGSLALGATKIQTIFSVTIRAARSGILTGVVLGFGRAVGETMAVILVAGNSPQVPDSILSSVRTLTSTVALEMSYASGRHSEMLYAIGIVLFIFIVLLNLAIMRLNKKAGDH